MKSVAIAVCLAFSLLAAAIAACGPSKPTQAALSSSESWCPDGFEVGPQDTCFVVPDKHDKDTPVLVYLHGSYEAHGNPDEWAVVRSAVDRGYAVVIPRGRRGACAWKAELANHFCWPQEVEDPQSFKIVVGGWDRVLWQVDALLEGGPHKRYVLGYGNGGAFASFLATQGLFDAKAYAIVDAAPLAAAKYGKTPPLMLLTAQGDPDEAAKTKAMHETLAKAGVMHAFCTRPGAAGMTKDDLDAALKFFDKDAKGALKPTPDKAYACEPPTKRAEPEK